MNVGERKFYFDYLRILATFAVIVLHVAASGLGVDVNSFEYRVFNFYDSMVRWSVPVFVMISGALFLERDIPLRIVYSKYISRMVIAFIVWSLFYSLIDHPSFFGGWRQY